MIPNTFLCMHITLLLSLRVFCIAPESYINHNLFFHNLTYKRLCSPRIKSELFRYIDEPMIQNFINIAGHYINGNVGRFTDVGDRNIQVGSQEKDHITQCSNIGAGGDVAERICSVTEEVKMSPCSFFCIVNFT